jgi:plastocyanin
MSPRPRAFAAVLLIALAACAAPGPPAQHPAVAAVVRMTDNFMFEPASVTIRAGETVEWRNASRFRHSVTADPAQGRAVLPPGAQPFASGELAPGQSFRRTLTAPGTYRYFCTPHEGIGMQGEIKVLPAR